MAETMKNPAVTVMRPGTPRQLYGWGNDEPFHAALQLLP